MASGFSPRSPPDSSWSPSLSLQVKMQHLRAAEFLPIFSSWGFVNQHFNCWPTLFIHVVCQCVTFPNCHFQEWFQEWRETNWMLPPIGFHCRSGISLSEDIFLFTDASLDGLKLLLSKKERTSYHLPAGHLSSVQGQYCTSVFISGPLLSLQALY